MEGQDTPAKPAWQSEELEEEWIDQEEEEHLEDQADASPLVNTTSDLSFTQTHGIILDTSSSGSNAGTSSVPPIGTVLVREDVPPVPCLPQTPAIAKKMVGKTFFSPLALERMFEPPSPPMEEPMLPPLTAHKNTPAIPSRLSRVYVPSVDLSTDSLEGLGEADMEESLVWQGEQGEGREEERQDTTEYEFTFAAPGINAPRSLLPATCDPSTPQALPLNPFTPSHLPLAPITDPRLRLFQFQYDTFTRDHLSAMVDSIAVNTPAGDSGTANSKESSPAVPPSPSETSISRLRSAKRLKLSPASDFSGDGEALIIRPHSRVDYVGESRSLMDKIRQARDFSTISTTASALTPMSFEKYSRQFDEQNQELNEPNPFAPVVPAESRATSSTYAASSRKSVYSSVQLREQAADLMAQIRNDVKSHKRLFTQGSDATSIRQGPEYDPGMDSIVSDDVNSIVYGDETENLSDREQELTDTLDLYNASLQATRDVDTQGGPDDDTELAQSVGNISLDSVSLMEQFPPLPIALIVSSSSTSSHASVPEAVSPARAGGSKPNYLSPYTGGFALAHPSTSARANMNPDDLNRFVSSSTASGATLTSGTTASIVRHEARPIKLITPDSQMIPQRVGEMVFDQYLKKWVKATATGKHTQTAGISARTIGSNESEDPFRDIESLHEDDSPTAPEFRNEEPVPSGTGFSSNQDAKPLPEVSSDSEAEDAEEVELTSFSFDGNSLQAEGKPVPVHQPESASDSGSGEENEDYPAEPPRPHPQGAGLHQSLLASQDTPPHRAPSSEKIYTPLPPSGQPSRTLTPAVQSATQKSASVTPVSALKDPNRNRSQTPANQLARKRSVSFSDGKREGPIVGVGRNALSQDDTMSSEFSSSVSDIVPVEPSGATLEPSARSKRIAGMLEDLEDTSYDTESPLRTSTGRPQSSGLQHLSRRQNGSSASWLPNSGGGRGRSRRSLSHSHSARSLRFAGGNANATFLTECSFGVAHDRLVQVITDVQPFEPYWENLSAIDLSRKELDSVARLKEFLPKLDSLNLNSNQLAWLSGIPGSVRSLSVASNCHLLNLESLDISNNNIDSLRQLECLRHLRELRADGNMIDSIDGLQKMDGLIKLSLQGNDIQDIDLTWYRWTRLEMLNLSHNKLNRLRGLSTQALPALIALNLDFNSLRELEVEGGSMARVRILRVSNNRLQQLNAGPFPNARTLYADNNCLGPIFKAHRLTKLENLSLRNQSGRAGLSLSIQDVRDVKRLYLSGNPLKAGFISEPCYNLIYLELAACRVTSLPSDLARLLPNLRVFNLNYNFLEDVRPLQGLTRLRKLTIIGSRVKATREFVKILRGMLDVEMLDFRMNPCTLGWYLPLLVKDIPGALQPSDDGDRRTLAGPSSSRAASSSNPASNPVSAVETGKQASSLKTPANPSTRTEFNVSTRGDGTGATARLARGANGASKSTSDHDDGDARPAGGAIRGDAARDGGADHVDQPAQTASHTTARQDGDADPLLPPPRAKSSPPRHVQQQYLQRSRQDGRGTPPKPKGLLAGAGAGAGVTWKDLDAKFRRDLPDDVYVGRLAYRGLVMRACPRIRMLDGIEVSEKERDKAERLLESVLDRRRPPASSVGQQQPPPHPPQLRPQQQQQPHQPRRH